MGRSSKRSSSRAKGSTAAGSDGAKSTPKVPKRQPQPPAFEEFVAQPPETSGTNKAQKKLGKRQSNQSRQSTDRLPTFEEFSPGQARTKTPSPSPAKSDAKSATVQSTVTEANATATTNSDTGTQPESKSAQPDSDASANNRYTERTQRIQAWSNLFKALQPIIWAVVILVVLIPLGSKLLLSYALNPSQAPFQRPPLEEVTIQPLPKREGVEAGMVEAVQSARTSAQALAEAELAEWTETLEPRVDRFLDWYFNYFNQKKMEFTTPFVWASSAAMHRLNLNSMTANEAVTTRLTEDFQREFAKQVLVPRNAQMQLELLTTDTVRRYLEDLSENIGKVKSRYRIPQGDWERYLDDISITIRDTEGNLSNLSLKLLVGGSGYLVTKPLVLATAGKIGSKVSTKLAGTATAKLAAKTGGAVAAELGTSLVDPIVGVGIFIWDIWDYQHTVELERPILRANLLEYLQGVQQSLLRDPETGIMSAIYQLEQGIFKSL